MQSAVTNTSNSVATQAVTTADGLTVGGIIVPIIEYITYAPIVTDVSKAIFVAIEAIQVTSVREVHGIASVSGTLQIEKLTGTTAPASGITMLTGTINLAATANTVVSGTLTGTTSTLQLAAGDRIGIVLAGTLTSLVGSIIQITFKRI